MSVNSTLTNNKFHEQYLNSYRLALKASVGVDLVPTTTLMRCKPRAYYDTVESIGIEVPYAYDYRIPTGHAWSVMNNRVRGLFFHVHGACKYYTFASPFGDRRMKVNAVKMLDMNVMNVYYVDFYCLATASTMGKHELTVVVAEKNSVVDRQLAEDYKLILLPTDDTTKNPWLHFDQNTGILKMVNPASEKLRLEIVFTNDVHLEDVDATFDDVQAIGFGRSSGCSRNISCSNCDAKIL